MIDPREFQKFGYCVIPDAFSEEELISLRKAADFILELLINSSLANSRTSARLDIRSLASGSQVVRKVQPFVDLSLAFSQLAHESRLIYPLQMLMQDEPELIEDKITYKQHLPTRVLGLEERSAEDRFLVHCDWMYHSEQNYPATIINAAVALDDAPHASGPLKVWPGTHKERFLHERIQSSYAVPEHLLQHVESEELTVKAGAVVFFHGLLLHSSEPNRTHRPRRMAIFSYLPRSQSIGFDVRNGPTRYAEAPYEWHYAALRQDGTYVDMFRLPTSRETYP